MGTRDNFLALVTAFDAVNCSYRPGVSASVRLLFAFSEHFEFPWTYRPTHRDESARFLFPGAPYTAAFGINARGQIVGIYRDEVDGLPCGFIAQPVN